MSNNFQEDLFIGTEMGPTIKRDHGDRTFSIVFPPQMQFMTASRASLKVVHDKYNTVGEANRGRLHELLDVFIDDLLKKEV